MGTVRPDGSLSDKPMDSSDATKWLQELLRGDFQKAQSAESHPTDRKQQPSLGAAK